MRLKPRPDERLERDSHLLAFLLFIVRYFPQPFHFLILPAHATPPVFLIIQKGVILTFETSCRRTLYSQANRTHRTQQELGSITLASSSSFM
jgi:hypothetical protein